MEGNGERSAEVKEKKLRNILTLFLTFMKIGAFTFGGGYAMISVIQRETVEKHKWITDEDILDIVAIAESTPGPIAINAATFVGFQVAGFWGSFFATLGIVIPSFVIISVIALILSQFKNSKVVKYAFNGIRAGVLALIIKAFVSMFKKCPKDIAAYIIMALAFMSVAIFRINSILVLLACALIGLSCFLIVNRRREK